MGLRSIFEKFVGKKETASSAFAPTVYDDTAHSIPQPPEKPVNAVMMAIRSSELQTATLLMNAGAPVDFSDPAIETQMRVATYETNFEFLNALVDRRKMQDAEEKEKARKADVTAAQEAEGAQLQKLAGIAMAMSEGADGKVAAPKTASFRKKNGPAA